MNSSLAVNTVFAAYNVLPRKDKRKLIKVMLQDKEFEDELIDLAIIRQREKEESISMEDYMKHRKKIWKDGL